MRLQKLRGKRSSKSILNLVIIFNLIVTILFVGFASAMNSTGEPPARSRTPYDFKVEFAVDSNTIEPSQQELFDLKVTNQGDNPDTYDLSVTGIPANWSVKLMHNAVEVTKINVDEGKSETMQVIISVNASGEATITVTATSAIAGDKSDSIAITVGYVIQIHCENPNQYLAAGEARTFNLNIKNHQSAVDEVNLDTDTVFQIGNEPDDVEWVIAFETTTLPVNASSYNTTEFQIFAPYNAVPPQKTTFKIVGTSTATSETFYSNQIEAIITNIYNITTSIKPKTPSADPGETVNYTVTITNNGNSEDKIKLTTLDNLDNWAITLKIDDVPFDIHQDELVLAQGTSETLKAEVTVPANAPTGLHHLNFGVSSKGGDQGNLSIVTDVNQFYTLELKIYKEPNIVELAATSYVKMIAKNTGNGQDTLTFQISTSSLQDDGWNAFFHSVETSDSNINSTKKVDFDKFSIIDAEKTKFRPQGDSKYTTMSITMSSGQSTYITIGVITPQVGSWDDDKTFTVYGETSNLINKDTKPLEISVILKTSELEFVTIPTLSAQNLTIGDTLQVEIDVKNNFHVSAKNFNAILYLGNLPGEADKSIDSELISELGPNSTQTVTLKWKIPENTAVGTYLLKVRLEGDIISENNEPERIIAVAVSEKEEEAEDDSIYILLIIVIVAIIVVSIILVAVIRRRAKAQEPEEEASAKKAEPKPSWERQKQKPSRPLKGRRKARR